MQGERDKAAAAFREALTIKTKLVADFPKVENYRLKLALTYDEFGTFLRDTGDPRQAEAAVRQGLSICKKLVDDFPNVPHYRLELAEIHNNLGVLLLGFLNNPTGAKEQFREALNIEEDLVAKFKTENEYAVNLAMTYRNMGLLMTATHQEEAALGWFGNAIAKLEPVSKEEPTRSDVRESLRYAHWGRAEALTRLGRHAEALKDWDRTLELDDGQNRLKSFSLRFQHALTLARLKEHERATAEADALAKSKDAGGSAPYYAARVYAVTSSVMSDKEQADQYGAHAVELLRPWAEKVPLPEKTAALDMLTKDPLLAPLRDRNDYQEILKGLEKKTKP
jgi:tetratricopeptide (TPR) repeat protein